MITMADLEWNRAISKYCVREKSHIIMSIFYSSETGIANAISSFKWMKNNIIYEKYTFLILNYWINWAST